MAWLVPWRLGVLAPCILIRAGTASAEDIQFTNFTENARVSQTQGIPTAADAPIPTSVSPLFDSSTIGTAVVPGSPSPIATKNPIIPHIAVNGYGDADSLGNRTAYGDLTFAPFSGIYESGLRFRAAGDASWYRFITSESPRTLGEGHYIEGDFLVGYGLWVPRFNVTGFVGPAYAQIDDLGATTQRWGVKGSLEINAKPTDWTIASASASYSTVENNLQVQAKTGVRVFEGVYLGPEAKFQWQRLLPVEISFFTPAVTTATAVSPDRNISYVHLGGFSALNIGPVVIGVSGGWAHDQQLGSGYYGSASLYAPF